ncbi:MAG: AbrB/MazE/SpoVT family DNA-binding domain-containing protein [Anaerolineales bacterium]
MSRKIFKTGNSLVVSLPKDVIEYLEIGEGAEVDLKLDREQRRIVIEPAENRAEVSGIDSEFTRQVADFIEEYRPALEELAKK